MVASLSAVHSALDGRGGGWCVLEQALGMDGFDFTAAPAPATTEPLALDGFDFGAPAAPAEAEAPAAEAPAAEEPAAPALDMMAGFQTEEVTTTEEVS